MKISEKGFSLIELLVVLAILTILMGLVVPKVGRMMDEAKEHKCRNNLRQLHTAVISHVNDNDGKLPRAMSYEVYDSIGDRYYERRGWIAWQPPGGSLSARWPDSGRSSKSSKENGMIEDCGTGEDAIFGIENGEIFAYMNESIEHYACPLIKKKKEDEIRTETKDKHKKVYRTYAMNGFFLSPRNPNWHRRRMTAIGTAESFVDTDVKPNRTYMPEAAKLLLFAEVEPTTDPPHIHSNADPAKGRSDKNATEKNKGDCCIHPTTIESTKDIIYPAHRSPSADRKASLAVFLDGHIEKIFPENSEGKNTAWFYARGLDPEDPLP